MATVSLFLVRHGETVDNVARLYAGSKDSELTSHGVLQARQLASHLVRRAAQIGPVTHIFSSDLRRAHMTAEAVRDAQLAAGSASSSDGLEILPLAELREKDFGSMEGRSGRRDARPGDKDAAFVATETHESVEARIAVFVNGVLLPVLESLKGVSSPQSIVVVAHGIILHRLYLFLFPKIVASWEASAKPEPSFLDNTAYHELSVTYTNRPSGDGAPASRRCYCFVARVQAINRRDHLAGLKKTRGGIGSAKFDPKQKSLEAFFKPAEKEDKSNG